MLPSPLQQTLRQLVSGPQSTLRHWIKAALVLVFLQGLYWSSHAWLNRPAPIPIDNQIRSWQVAELTEPTPAAAREATYTTQAFSDLLSSQTAPAYFAFRAMLELEAVPDADIGLGVAFRVDNAHIYINGAVVHDPGQLSPRASYHASRRDIIRVSRGLLRPGSNEILAITTTNAPGLGVRANIAILGDYKRLMDATAQRRFFFSTYRVFTLITAGIIALVLAVLIPQTRNTRAVLWLAVFATAIALRTAWPMYYGPFGGEVVRFSIILSLAMLVPIALLNFIGEWSSSPLRWMVRACNLAFIGALAIITIVLTRAPSTGYETAELITDLVMCAASLTAMVLLAHQVWRAETLHAWETGILILVVSLCLVDAFTLIIEDRDPGHLRLVSPIVLVGLVAGILSRNLRLFESLGAFNDALNTELDKRAQTIQANYIALADAEKQRNIAAERARILRDMHDGIGGQLTGLLVQLRAGRLNAEETTQGVTTALNDLRLVVESLDPDIQSLDEYFEAMRFRFTRQLSAAGFQLDWAIPGLQTLSLSPSHTLQIARILQESVTNAIRHSNGDRLQVEGDWVNDPHQFRLRIIDNGRVDPDCMRQSGHGLQNMASRAALIDAELSAGPKSGGGFEVELLLPPQPPSLGD